MKRDAMVEEVADYMVKVGCSDTESGSYVFYFDTFADYMYKDLLYSGEMPAEAWLQKNYPAIVEELETREEVAEEVWLSYDENGNVDGLDINFWLAYCGLVEDEEAEEDNEPTDHAKESPLPWEK